MTRHLLLACWLGAALCAAPMAGAQTYTPAAETRESESFELETESFPMVTPLPPKAPLPLPSDEPSLEPEPTPEPTPVPTATPTVKPSPKPTAKPTSKPTASPTSRPQGKVDLSYSFPKALTEGRRFKLRLELKGQVSYPVKGVARFEDMSWDYSKKTQEAVPFEIKGPGPQELSLLFRSPGRKVVRLEAAGQVRNAAVFAQPFTASVFPRPDNGAYERDPDLWQVWVNLHHSLGNAPQRQYYLVTYRGEIVQKLLTSSAAPGKLTPQGHFTLGVKIASPKSTLYDSVMPFWTTILIPGHSYEYGNHGLTGEAYLYSLGVPASHGCLRLSNKWVSRDGQWVNIGGAKWVYSHVPVGTKIHIFKKPMQPFAFENYSMWLARGR